MCAIVSDSTGNTRLHRELLVNDIPTMFNLPDIVHFISNTIKDIVKLEYFKPSITTMRGVITKFHKSHLGMAEISFAHVECHITRGLEAIGKTHFGTIILAAWALQYNIPAIKRVVERRNFDLGVGAVLFYYHYYYLISAFKGFGYFLSPGFSFYQRFRIGTCVAHQTGYTGIESSYLS